MESEILEKRIWIVREVRIDLTFIRFFYCISQFLIVLIYNWMASGLIEDKNLAILF